MRIGASAVCGKFRRSCLRAAPEHPELLRVPRFCDEREHTEARPVSPRTRPRDLDGDGLADVIGFGSGNVYTSLNQGISGFAPVTVAVPGLGNDQGFTNTSSIRSVADVNGDGLPDVVVIGADNVQVALRTATG